MESKEFTLLLPCQVLVTLSKVAFDVEAPPGTVGDRTGVPGIEKCTRKLVYRLLEAIYVFISAICTLQVLYKINLTSADL